MIHSDLDSLRATLASLVDEHNLDREDQSTYSWKHDELTYYPDEELKYGSFAWARIQEAPLGYTLRVSEFA